MPPSIDEVEAQTGVHVRVAEGSRESLDLVVPAALEDLEEAAEVQEAGSLVEGDFGSSSLEVEVVAGDQSSQMDLVDQVGRGLGVVVVRRLVRVEVREMIEGR